MQKIKLTEGDLEIDIPLQWPLLGGHGELLLDKGQSLSSEKQKNILLNRGIFRELSDFEVAKAKKNADFILTSPFNVLEALKINLKRILFDIINNNVGNDLNDRVIKLAKIIQKLCFENSDAALGAIILDQNSAYTNIHPILCAILTELLSRRQKIPKKDRLLYIAAALTQNVGMLELQNQLVNQKGALTDKQKLAIKQHPFQSKEILNGHGIDHKEWLDTVLYHHERPNGTGYPSALTGDKIPVQAKILSMCDIYSAMILPRKYRDGFFVKKALQDIFIQRGQLVDESIAQLLIKEIGIYPPGTFVKIANGDTAIVLRRGTKNANSPLVLTIISPRGAFYETKKRRDTIHQDIYGITSVIPRPENLELNHDEIWGLGQSRP